MEKPIEAGDTERMAIQFSQLESQEELILLLKEEDSDWKVLLLLVLCGF